MTLFGQYDVALPYTKKYKMTVVPLGMVMASTSLAAILYGALTPTYSKEVFDARGFEVPQKSSVYVAWYVVALSETVLTVTVSCYWRVISFKGTHMVQRMSLLTLIILGEGIIVICRSISKNVKNEYFWSAPVVGQIIADVLRTSPFFTGFRADIVAAIIIIYFLYMLYFDRLQEEHFGSIQQQAWSFLHFPLHTVLVLVLQGVSLLIVWCQAVESINALYFDWSPTILWLHDGDPIDPTTEFGKTMAQAGTDNVTDGAAFATYFNWTC